MTGGAERGFAAIGRALWDVEWAASLVADTGSHLEEDASYDQWSDAVYENSQIMRGALVALKQSILQLPPEIAAEVAQAFHRADQEALASGAAHCLVANIQREFSEKKGSPK